jgi:hypothetical protein
MSPGGREVMIMRKFIGSYYICVASRRRICFSETLSQLSFTASIGLALLKPFYLRETLGYDKETSQPKLDYYTSDIFAFDTGA